MPVKQRRTSPSREGSEKTVTEGAPDPQLPNAEPAAVPAETLSDEAVTLGALCCAMIGGVSPYIVQMGRNWNQESASKGIEEFLVSLANSSGPTKIAAVTTFALPWIAAALCAAFLAWLWKEKNHYRAFVFGMSAPALFVSIVLSSTGQDGKETVTPIVTSSVSFAPVLAFPRLFTTAKAQEPKESSHDPDGVFRFDLSELPKNCADCAITYFDHSGAALRTESFAATAASTTTVARTEIPMGAASAVISGIEGTNDAKFDVDAARQATGAAAEPAPIALSRRGNWFNGVRVGVGVQGLQYYDLQMRIEP